MLIVLEGGDGAGKTTLAQMLRDEFVWERGASGEQVTYLHKGPPNPDVPILHQYEVSLEGHLTEILSDGHLVICDRWHVGELVYGPRFRKESLLTVEQALHVDMFLDALGAVKIVCQASAARIKERIKADPVGAHLPSLSVADAVEINEWYHAWFGWSVPWTHVETDRVKDDAQLTMFIRLAANRTRRARYLNEIAPGYVGNLWPKYLLAGDRRGDGPLSDEAYLRAFTPGRRGSSAEYLLHTLKSDGSHPVAAMTRQSMIINANEPGMQLKPLMKAIANGEPENVRVIALGSSASSTLSTAGVDHRTVSHPQYWKRFKAGNLAGYRDYLAKASEA